MFILFILYIVPYEILGNLIFIFYIIRFSRDLQWLEVKDNLSSLLHDC